MKINHKIHGAKPLKVVVVHGGPGATGDMQPVAKELAKSYGVLESLQTAKSIIGQLEELVGVLEKHANLPVILIGHSWGAWLSFILAARHPKYVEKVILVSAPPFKKEYAENIMSTRMDRLSTENKEQLKQIVGMFADPSTQNADLNEFKKFIVEVDSYDPQFYKDNGEEFHIDIFRQVWPEANDLRDSGELLPLGKQIKCPVVAIHGDSDSHPYEGVQTPLNAVLKDFKFILLEKCGHTPWIEKYARNEFYEVLRQEIKDKIYQ